MRPRRLLFAVAVVVLAAGAYLSAGPPRITLLNASLVVDYPWPRGIAALFAGLALAALAALLTQRVLRSIGFVLALGPLLVAGHLLLYRLEARGDALAARGLFGASTIAWKDVSGVDLEAGAPALVVRGAGADAIRIDTSDFAPEQRAMLERTLARHVREQGGRGLATAP